MTLEERLERLERKIDGLSRLIKDMKRPYWVKAGVITELTGWNAEKMRQARDNGYIQYEERVNGERTSFFYNLNSSRPNNHFRVRFPFLNCFRV